MRARARPGMCVAAVVAPRSLPSHQHNTSRCCVAASHPIVTPSLDSYAEAVAAVAASGGRRRASERGGASKGRRAGGTAALEERLHALYLGENVIPLPVLRASSAAALALQPYPEPAEEAAWLQVLADVALESYSGAPGSKPDRAHAIPPAALQQVACGAVCVVMLCMLLCHRFAAVLGCSTC